MPRGDPFKKIGGPNAPYKKKMNEEHDARSRKEMAKAIRPEWQGEPLEKLFLSYMNDLFDKIELLAETMDESWGYAVPERDYLNDFFTFVLNNPQLRQGTLNLDNGLAIEWNGGEDEQKSVLLEFLGKGVCQCSILNEKNDYAVTVKCYFKDLERQFDAAGDWIREFLVNDDGAKSP